MNEGSTNIANEVGARQRHKGVARERDCPCECRRARANCERTCVIRAGKRQESGYVGMYVSIY